jgi:hypothetical protein
VTPLPRVGIIQAGVCKAWDEEGEMWLAGADDIGELCLSLFVMQILTPL